jgi:hypothetical protein
MLNIYLKMLCCSTALKNRIIHLNKKNTIKQVRTFSPFTAQEDGIKEMIKYGWVENGSKLGELITFFKK